MIAAAPLTEEILQLKRERRAMILAHHYQEPEIQELADAIGDSLELARRAREFDGDVIAFCGVWFMAETAKVLNPTRTVVVPDREASCSLVESCSAGALRAWRRAHPEYAIVSYINTSVEVKAESDILCTSRNVPDRNLGRWVERQTGRTNMRLWQGTCIVHATWAARRLAEARAGMPGAMVAAHPECDPEVLEQADFVGSTTAIIKWCVDAPASEFIVMTESGVQHSLNKLAPHKRFHFIPNEQCSCSECPFMRRNTLEKLRDCLATLEPRVELPEDTMRRALAPLERMLAIA